MDSPSAASAVEQATSYAADLKAPAAAADLESTVRQLTRPLRSSGAPDDLARGTHVPSSRPATSTHPRMHHARPGISPSARVSCPSWDRTRTLLLQGRLLYSASARPSASAAETNRTISAPPGPVTPPDVEHSSLLSDRRASGANGARQGYQLIAIPCRNSKCIVRTSSP